MAPSRKWTIADDGSFSLGVIGDVPPEGICGSGLVDLLSELLRTGRMNEMGRFEDGVRASISTRERGERRAFICWKAMSTNWRRPRAPTSRVCTSSSASYGIDFDDIEVFYLAGGFGRHLNVEAAKRIGLVPNLAVGEDRAGRQRGDRRRDHRAALEAKRQELEELVKRVEHCRLETHPRFFDFFVEGCQFKPVEPMPCAEVADKHRTGQRAPDLNVLPEEYTRLLGFPRGWVLEGRRAELADWARDWYAENGRPWIYARQAETLRDRRRLDSVSMELQFTSKRLQSTLQQAEAHSVILVAVGAGPEAEEEARRRWDEEKPDEYFFLEMYGSAVVEHLTTLTGARLCDWAEQHADGGVAALQPGLSGVGYCRAAAPARIDEADAQRALPFVAWKCSIPACCGPRKRCWRSSD